MTAHGGVFMGVGDFVMISAYFRAAPSAIVRFGLVGDLQDTGLIFKALHELKSTVASNLGGYFHNGR